MANDWKLDRDSEYPLYESYAIPDPYHFGPPVNPDDRLSII